MVEPTPGLDLDAVQRWFAANVDGFAGGFTEAELLHGGRSNLTYGLGDGRQRWVLRRPPLGLVAPSANDVGREFRFLSALAPTPVPVPRPVAMCPDPSIIGVPFTVVERVDGLVVRTPHDLRALGPSRAMRALVEGLAQLHTVDIADEPFASLGRAGGYATRQVDRWRRQWEVVRTRALPGLDALHHRLAAAVPAREAAAIVHGDYRVDNVIYAPGSPDRIAAIIDWELSALGDPLADLGLTLVYWNPVCAAIFADGHPRDTGTDMPDESQLTAWYGAASGADLSDLDFFVALAAFKLAVIAEGIHRRFVDGDTVGRGFETVGSAVAPLVEIGLGRLG
jgi:aminoglycoside phosphotransferase (APT) family kinase protein